MTSEDVLHNFWVPALNGKRYLVPGQTTLLRLQADEPDEFLGPMRGVLRPLPLPDAGPGEGGDRGRILGVGRRSTAAGREAPAEGTPAAAGMDVFLNRGCTQCHNIDAINEIEQSAFNGPDLTHFMDRGVLAGAYQGILGREPQDLASQPPEVEAGQLHAQSRFDSTGDRRLGCFPGDADMTAIADRPTTIFRRPTAETGFWSWVTTVDHKKIGIMYGYTAFIFFIVGGLEALLLRIHLASAESNFLSAADYNGLFTTHAVTMIFLVMMPMSAAFMNYLLPLMIGARDVAFPRLNALSYWIFLFGGIFLYSGLIFSGIDPPNGVAGIPGNLDPSDVRQLRSDARRWLVHVSAQRRGPLLAQHLARLCRHRAPDPRHRLADLVRQLHRHLLQPASQGHAAPPGAGVHLDDAGRGVLASVLATDHRHRLVHGDVRPTIRHALLRCHAPAATRSSGSTCSGCSAIRRSTS